MNGTIGDRILIKTKNPATTTPCTPSACFACHGCSSILLLALTLTGSAPVDAGVADLCATPSFAAPRTFETGWGDSKSVATGDFNGDGKPDLAVAISPCDFCDDPRGRLSVLLGNGDGSFQPPTNYLVVPNVNLFSVAVADLNGDGKLDLAVATQEFTTTVKVSASVLLGNGDGTFQDAVNFATGPGFVALAVADFNGDGKLDLALANQGSGSFNYIDGSVSVLLGKGDGSFQAAIHTGVTFGSSLSPLGKLMAVGDLNGDGKADLAVVRPDYGTVSVLLGKGDGSFLAAIDYQSVRGPASVVVDDLNGRWQARSGCGQR